MSQMLPDSEQRQTTTSLNLLQILGTIESPLRSVNELLASEVQSCSDLLKERLADSGVSSGKRIRPALLLMSGACFGDINNTHVAAAAALELVHVATLVHDDVLDQAEHRRHSQSLNAKWNNTISILTGDFLFSKAFDVACDSGSLDVMRQIAVASCKVCEGEITQNSMIGNFDVNEQQYTEMIALKTAELCRCACGVGALLSNCDTEMVVAFEKYGNDIGIAFQIIDDVLDIIGKPDQVGKTLGTDIINQKATLPIIHCLQQLDDNDRPNFLDELTQQEANLASIIDQLNSTGSIEYARVTARNYANEAFEFADSLPSSEYSKSLAHLAAFVIDRTY